MLDVRVKKLKDDAIIPCRGSEFSAGFDLYAYVEDSVVIPPHETKKIGTGISMELPDNTFGGIFARSGLATNQGLRPSNCTGVVDSDYRGEYIVALYNDSDTERIINKNDRIAQLIVIPFINVNLTLADKLTETERSNGGFGHTGL